jgi:UDP-GlcNAc:undecaprenyl-phosphate GlcNAc-1-phosphate transferase
MISFSSELIAYMSTALIIYFAGPKAFYIGLVDRPSSRKKHEGEIPLVGGIAIFGGFIISLFTLNFFNYDISRFIFPALLMFTVGMIDDIYQITYKKRFAAQILTGVFMTVWGGTVVNDLGGLVIDNYVFSLSVFSVPFTIICLVGVINAFNMLDGIDGLAGMLTLVAIVGLAILAYVAGKQESFHILLLLACCVFAFIGFNARFPWRKRAQVFMGDSGSMFIGFAITWFTVSLSQGEHAAMTPVTPLWLIALPLFDMTATMLRRIFIGRSPFSADCEHLHHVFLLAGFSVGQTVSILTGIATVLAMIGIGGLYLGVPENIMFYAFMSLFVFYFYFMMRSWKMMRFLRRSICRRRSGLRDRRLRLGGDRRTSLQPQNQDKKHSFDRRSNPDRRRNQADRRRKTSSLEMAFNTNLKVAPPCLRVSGKGAVDKNIE